MNLSTRCQNLKGWKYRMQDQEKRPDDSPLLLEGERRKEDRRQNDRQGKYDRRKNRCMHCLHFQEEATTGKGQCNRHDITIAAYAFACPQFSPLLPEARK